LNKDLYQICLSKYEKKELNCLSWEELAKEYSYENGEKLRSQFRRIYKSVEQSLDKPSQENSSSYEEGQDFINVLCSSKRLLSVEEVLKQFKIDTQIWEVDRYKVSTHEGYRKDRAVKWEVSDGKVIEGRVDDSGRLLVVPLFSIQVHLKRKVQRVTKEKIEDIFKNIKYDLFSAANITRFYPEKSSTALIIGISDVHLGLLSKYETSNSEYNIKIATDLYRKTIEKITEKIASRNFDEIVLLCGNDFLNCDNHEGTTSRGTPQDMDGFYYNIIDSALSILVATINYLLNYAPIKIYNVVSNHDQNTMYLLMKCLECFYRGYSNVWVDTGILPRKYYTFSSNLFGFSHDLKIKTALQLMTVEAKDEWGRCNQFYWLLGHLHQAMQYEKEGLMEIYRLPTFSSASRWLNNNGFIQAEKRSQCFVVGNKGIEEVWNIVL